MLRRAGSTVAEKRSRAHADVDSDVERGHRLRQQHSEDEERSRGRSAGRRRDQKGTREQQAQSDRIGRQAVSLSNEHHSYAKRPGRGSIEQSILYLAELGYKRPRERRLHLGRVPERSK